MIFVLELVSGFLENQPCEPIITMQKDNCVNRGPGRKIWIPQGETSCGRLTIPYRES